MKSNIVFFHLFNNFSGSPKVLRDIISLTHNDYNISLVTSNSIGFLSNIPVKTKLIPYSWTSNKILLLFRFLRAQLYLIIYALTFNKKNTIFYINTHQPSIVGLIGKLAGKRIIFHIHETHKSQKHFGLIYKLIRKMVKGDEIFVSEFIKNIEEIESNRSKVIYNTVSDKFYDKTRSFNYLPYKNDSFNVIMICSLKDYKGVPELLEICQLLNNKKNISFQLIVDANKNEIANYFKNFTVANNIKIFTRTINPEPYYNNASLLLCLTRMEEWIETFGLTVLEAMTFGIPCIVPPLGGPTELVDHNINGYQISGNNTEKIAQTILKLSNNPNLCNTLSIKAKIKSENFKPSIFKGEILNFIQRI